MEMKMNVNNGGGNKVIVFGVATEVKANVGQELAVLYSRPDQYADQLPGERRYRALTSK